MFKVFAWAIALTMMAGTLAFAAIDCCADPSCCPGACCHRTHLK